MFREQTQKYGYKLTNKQKNVPFFVTQIGSTLEIQNSANASYTRLLPYCGLVKTTKTTHLPIYRKTETKDAKAKPATGRKRAAALTVEETRKQPRELDSLTYWSQFTHKGNMTRSIFPASRIRLFLISRPLPR
uniref:Uncharacterized protein n=1 Tax=Arundo donax TaxID=35708 RepID=A0A0A9FQT1_ARUDO